MNKVKVPKLFAVHITRADGDRTVDTITADNPKHAERIVRKAYTGEVIAIRKIKFVKGSGV